MPFDLNNQIGIQMGDDQEDNETSRILNGKEFVLQSSIQRRKSLKINELLEKVNTQAL